MISFGYIYSISHNKGKRDNGQGKTGRMKVGKKERRRNGGIVNESDGEQESYLVLSSQAADNVD